MRRLVVSGLLFVLAACPAEKPAEQLAEKPAESPAEAPTAPAPAAPTPSAPAAPSTGPEIPEPPGVAAGTHKTPAPPTGAGAWTVDPASTTVAFTIVSNSAGPITGRFPNATSGSIDEKSGRGVFTVDLTRMVTVNKDNATNAVRDSNVIEAFFAARPFSIEERKQAVADVWSGLAGKIASGVSSAALVVDSVEGGATKVKDGETADGVVNGKLVLWESVEVPVSFPVTASRKGDAIEVKGTAPSTFNIEKATGSAVRKKLFDTMLAAGCAHQPGIQNDVSVALEQVTLKKAK